ncbi:MAG: VWA domain-containing protein [Caldilineaceae bacterium]|nr:VWA domain-containing protein [Caldilineaceae bacterium]
MEFNGNDIAPGNLLRNCVLFGRLLRRLGVEITPTQMVDLVDSLKHVDIGSRRDFKNSARSVLINRRDHLEIFDHAFDLFWQARDKEELESLDLGMFLRKLEQPPQQIQTISPAESATGDEPQSDDSELDRTFTYSNVELLRQKDFTKLNELELAQLKQLMLKTKWNLAERRTRRTERASRGDYVDLRRTFRQNLRHGGEPLHLLRRNRRYKKRPFVVICDISGSMERYSRVLLQFIYAITSELDRVEAFVFSTRLTRITRQLKRRDVDVALDEAATVIHDWAGGTRIGESIKSFNYDWARRVLGQGAIVMLISDGWDRGDVSLLGREMDRLHRSCHQLIWLNPLLGAANYEPLVRGIQAALPHIDYFLPVHNLASLEQLAELLESGFAS